MHTGTWIGLGILALVLLWLLWSWWRKRQARNMMTSLVLLLSAPRQMTDDALREIIGRVFNIHFDPLATDATEFIMPLPSSEEFVGVGGRSFFIQIPQGVFIVHNATIPYHGVNEEEAMRTIRDSRLRHILRDHRAWLSVDLLRNNPKERPDIDAYPSIDRKSVV